MSVVSVTGASETGGPRHTVLRCHLTFYTGWDRSLFFDEGSRTSCGRTTTDPAIAGALSAGPSDVWTLVRSRHVCVLTHSPALGAMQFTVGKEVEVLSVRDGWVPGQDEHSKARGWRGQDKDVWAPPE